MALMFPRLAHNFAKNGYYPTDNLTIERILNAIRPTATGTMRIIDPCAGEGVAIAECAHHLDRQRTEIYAVEYNHKRAEHCRTLADRTLKSDLVDTMISRHSFGLLFLNPPYGDLPSNYSEDLYYGRGRKRLEKLFYQKTYPLLQFGGVLVLIIPYTIMDEELATWITTHFTQVEAFLSPESQFKQMVIFGIRCRSIDHNNQAEIKCAKEKLLVFKQERKAKTITTLPEVWSLNPYTIPAAQNSLKQFFRTSFFK